MSDSIIGVRYKGGVMIAADSQNARSILVYQNNLDKISKIAPNAILGLSGPNSDLVSFSEYVTKNLTLYHLSNEGSPLSTHSIANFCRGELATALRKGPFQVQTVLGGWDKTKSKPNQPVVEDDEGAGSLYFLDYMGSMQKVPYALQGYCSNFCLSILDREWKEDMTEAEAFEVIQHCIDELKVRFLISQPKFCIKKVDKNGVTVLKPPGSDMHGNAN